jgi:hypothetical protein
MRYRKPKGPLRLGSVAQEQSAPFNFQSSPEFEYAKEKRSRGLEVRGTVLFERTEERTRGQPNPNDATRDRTRGQ